jgi:hypothetical protein
LRAGKLPTMPALHWAMTRWGFETMNNGAPITGRRRRESASGNGFGVWNKLAPAQDSSER